MKSDVLRALNHQISSGNRKRKPATIDERMDWISLAEERLLAIPELHETLWARAERMFFENQCQM